MTSKASEAASSSSSVSNNSFTYQVFLSFRGEDTRHNFTDTLYNILCEKGINTFIDDKLPKGEKISAELVKAINESEVSIIVFSENYASSRWCLDELVEILQCKASNQHQVRPIFYKVDPSHVRRQKGKFGDAFNKLDRGSRYKDSMPKWRKALSDAADLSGWHFSDGESEFKFISKIVKELSINVLIPSNDLEVAKYPIGVDLRRQHVEKLLDMENDSVQMLGIWGPGGVGKSTIAKAVFNSIERNFESSCFLADVRSNSIPHRGLDKLQDTLLSDMRVSYMRMMQQKKVLLVLDDVSDLKQLEKLAPSSYCFGPGSRIIITTRDERVLAVHDVDSIYGVEMLDDVQASELFSWHAFNCDGPPEEYRGLTKRAVNYAGGLPLALVVLGSHLFCRSIEEWQDTFNSSKGDHRMDIENVLKISYDALGPDLKEMFLDIACFFNGGYVIDVKPIFEACYDLKPVIGLKQLEEKALIRVVDMFGTRDRIWMHDLIDEMGKNIGKTSRLWNRDDVDRALRDNYGTKEIRGIQIPAYFGDSKLSLNAKSFSEMRNLKFISMGHRNFELSSVIIDYLSNELRWLHWPKCPLLSFPTNFSPKKLVRLSIIDSCIIRLWEGQNILQFLKYIRLEDCPYLEELPVFTGTPNLESLVLMKCPSLVGMHHSVGALHKLVTLCVEGCFRLTAFPNFNGNTDSLRELTLHYFVKLTTMPCSIYGFQHLQSLSLHGFSRLTAFPTNTKNLLDDNGTSGGRLSLPRLKNLKVTECNLSNCDFLRTLDCLDTLTCLDLSYNKFLCHLPKCIGKFLNLEELNLQQCPSLKEVPELPPNLRKLDVSECESLERFWNLSDVLKGQERQQQFKWINLWNCGKLVGFNMGNLVGNLLNKQANSPFFVVFPGTITVEDARWLDCWTRHIGRETNYQEQNSHFLGDIYDTYDVFLDDKFFSKCSITISKTLKWENLALAVCAVSRGTVLSCEKTIYINGVGISLGHWSTPSLSTFAEDHVWVDYIPLPVEMKAAVDDQKGYSALPHYQCVVEFKIHARYSQPIESVGVHLVCLPSKNDETSSQGDQRARSTNDASW